MWDLVPVVLLRYAGFPFDLLGPLAHEAAADEANALLFRTHKVTELAQHVKETFRKHGIGNEGDLASGVGMLRAVPEEVCSRIHPRLDSAGLADVFDDPSLRQVLLLSNDAGYRDFRDWLDHGGAGSAEHRRRMTDLPVTHLQRVTTKNETNSHVGPLSIARVTSQPDGITWSDGRLERRAFFAHWAGEALAEVFSDRPGLKDLVRPRRRPLAFPEGTSLRRYAFRTSSGMAGGWRFLPELAAEPTPEERWLWERCDGRRTRAALRTAWHTHHPHAEADGFDRILDGLNRNGWVVAHWEIPVGDPDPLSTLARLLDEAGPAGVDERALVERLERGLGRFASASPAGRAAALEEVKAEFSAATGRSANRAGGQHYADRTVLFEEAYGPVRNMTLGVNVAATLSAELALAYDLALLTSRRRLRRETELLRDWAVTSFGADTPVPLERFYAQFFEHKPALDRACDQIDRDVVRLESEIAEVLLGEHDGGEHRDKTGTALSHPCPDFEVYGLSGKPRDQVLHPAQCHVVVRDGRLELRADGIGQRLRLMAPLAGGPSIRRDSLVPFSFPRHFGGLGLRGPGRVHLPRIRYGRVVLQRELWRIPPGALRGWSPGAHRMAGDASEFVAACRLRTELGLPRHGFVKIPGEPNPIFVDWTSPLLVRQLFRLARRAETAVEFTEMLPAPDQLWLDVDGGRRTSEMRCAVFSGGPPAAVRDCS